MTGTRTASRLLDEALSDASGAAPSPFVGELLRLLRERPDEALAPRLLELAGGDASRRAALTDAVGVAARRLAPRDAPPTEHAGAEAWRALVEVAHRLHGSGVRALGRLPYVSDHLLQRLVAEGRSQRPGGEEATRRATGDAGDALAALAVSRQLRDTVADALGRPVTPTYRALYEYDPPGSHVRTHVDSRDFAIVVHLLVEHESGRRGPRESVLVAHPPGAPAPLRIPVRAGEAVVLRGRGTLHSWAPLGDDERRTMVAIGFEDA